MARYSDIGQVVAGFFALLFLAILTRKVWSKTDFLCDQRKHFPRKISYLILFLELAISKNNDHY